MGLVPPLMGKATDQTILRLSVLRRLLIKTAESYSADLPAPARRTEITRARQAAWCRLSRNTISRHFAQRISCKTEFQPPIFASDGRAADRLILQLIWPPAHPLVLFQALIPHAAP